VQSIKTDVLFMALNTSLKSSRLGEAGRPLAAIAIELRSQAGQLERIANVSAGMLRDLTAAATALAGEGAEGAGEGAAAALLAATARIHDAGASTERDVAALAAQGEGVLALLTRSTDRLDLKTDIGLALAQVLQDLPDEAAAAELCTADIHAPLGAILAQLRASYTMAQERALHDALTSEWGLDTALPPPPAEVASADALDDVLF
jgi:hypothetical protein